MVIVCPLFKQREKATEPTNYRPVSLLPAVGKLFDALQSESLCRFLVKNNIISAHQFRFLSGRSTTTQLVYIVDKWLKAIENRNGTVVIEDRNGTVVIENRNGTMAIFMDFMKAFDRVWHSGILCKLAACGVEMSSLARITDYLPHRFLSVRVGSTLSEPQYTSSDVP